MENNTAKHFVLQLGSLASLYLSLSFFLTLVFGFINIFFPDTADVYWEVEGANSMVRWGFAMTVVFFPTYLILTRLVNQTRRTDVGGSYLGLTKWLIYLSLLVGGGVLLGDLVAVIMAFLEGDITTRFILKALAVLVVVGAAFYYYVRDARGYWVTHEVASRWYGLSVLVSVLVISVAAVSNIASPTAARDMKLDEQQSTDLQMIQDQVVNTFLIQGVLPDTMSDISDFIVPTAPAGRPGYEYRVTENGFELCATFSSDAPEYTYSSYNQPLDSAGEVLLINAGNWQYKAGHYCFNRVIQRTALPVESKPLIVR